MNDQRGDTGQNDYLAFIDRGLRRTPPPERLIISRDGETVFVRQCDVGGDGVLSTQSECEPIIRGLFSTGQVPCVQFFTGSSLLLQLGIMPGESKKGRWKAGKKGAKATIAEAALVRAKSEANAVEMLSKALVELSKATIASNAIIVEAAGGLVDSQATMIAHLQGRAMETDVIRDNSIAIAASKGTYQAQDNGSTGRALETGAKAITAGILAVGNSWLRKHKIPTISIPGIAEASMNHINYDPTPDHATNGAAQPSSGVGNDKTGKKTLAFKSWFDGLLPQTRKTILDSLPSASIHILMLCLHGNEEDAKAIASIRSVWDSIPEDKQSMVSDSFTPGQLQALIAIVYGEEDGQ